MGNYEFNFSWWASLWWFVFKTYLFVENIFRTLISLYFKTLLGQCSVSVFTKFLVHY